MFIHTTRIEPREHGRLYVWFNNGMEGEIDLSGELWGEVFEPLQDPVLFATAKQDDVMGTVVWSNGADFAPEFLLNLLNTQQKKAA